MQINFHNKTESFIKSWYKQYNNKHSSEELLNPTEQNHNKQNLHIKSCTHTIKHRKQDFHELLFCLFKFLNWHKISILSDKCHERQCYWYYIYTSQKVLLP